MYLCACIIYTYMTHRSILTWSVYKIHILYHRAWSHTLCRNNMIIDWSPLSCMNSWVVITHWSYHLWTMEYNCRYTKPKIVFPALHEGIINKQVVGMVDVLFIYWCTVKCSLLCYKIPHNDAYSATVSTCTWITPYGFGKLPTPVRDSLPLRYAGCVNLFVAILTICNALNSIQYKVTTNSSYNSK